MYRYSKVLVSNSPGTHSLVGVCACGVYYMCVCVRGQTIPLDI